MNKKQWFLTTFSLKRKIFKKSFVVSNIILLILISLAANIDSIIRSFGGDFEEAYTIYYTDEFDQATYSTFEQTLDGGFIELENEVTIYNESYEITEEDSNVVVVHFKDSLEATITSNQLIGTALYNGITTALDGIKLQITAAELNLTPEDIVNLQTGVPIERVVLEDEGSTEIQGLIQEGMGVIIVMPLFFGLIMIIQMIGLEIFDEKSTKSMEVIMSNVDPKTHLKAKIIAANLFSLIQFALIVSYGLFGAGLRGVASRMSIPQVNFDLSSYASEISSIIILVVVLYFITNFLYSMVMAILASTANEVDDYQKIISPLMILMVVGFYTAIFSPLFDGATFAKIMAFIPFFSLMIVPGLYAGGNISLGLVMVIIGIMLLFTYLIYRIGVPIYKQSVLDYSTDNVFKRLISNIKRARE